MRIEALYWAYAYFQSLLLFFAAWTGFLYIRWWRGVRRQEQRQGRVLELTGLTWLIGGTHLAIFAHTSWWAITRLIDIGASLPVAQAQSEGWGYFEPILYDGVLTLFAAARVWKVWVLGHTRRSFIIAAWLIAGIAAVATAGHYYQVVDYCRSTLC